MAGVTGDIIAILDKIPIWKKVQETPARVDALEKRIAELEAMLSKAPGAACPSCGALEYRVSKSEPHGRLGHLGVKNVTSTCGACSFSDVDMVTPKAK